jgi:hypothetical protein
MALTDILRSQVPGALGLGTPDAGLEKLTILYEQGGVGRFTGQIRALFNPSSLTLEENVEWAVKDLAIPGLGYVLEFKGKDNRKPPTLTLDLLFDTYEGDHTQPSIAQSVLGNIRGTPLALFPGSAPSRTSVTRYTSEVARLARIDRELHRPPICQLKWGRFQIFEGVLTSLTQRFTLFQPDGTPVRATLAVSFTQYQSIQEAMRDLDLHSADVPKRHTVRRGDTLSSIAAEAYNDPGMWRHIAKANGIHNPRALTPGQVLRLPKLKT